MLHEYSAAGIVREISNSSRRSRLGAKALFTFSAAYLAIVGLALMIVPLQFGRGAVPPDAGPELIALLRLLGGPFLGIAVLNWLVRDTDPSKIRPVVLANMIGFGAVAANDAWGVASGEARDIAKYFLAAHGLFMWAFAVLAYRTRRKGCAD